MYKSKLQILCQRNSWGLPEFSSTKSGLDHNPSFTATVTINGVPFTTTDHSRTVKEAQNKAAKIAFDHFSNSPQRPVPVSVPVPGFPASMTNLGVRPSIGGISQLSTMETIQTPLMNETPVGVKDDMKFVDVRHLCKNRLQNYAQKRNLPLPEYSSEREGPPHASRFKSKVTIEGNTYESPEFFPTVKEAEHAAAKVACESLSVNDVQEDDSGLYKNLLQELAQKEGFDVPKYETTISGPSHMPTFVSTVEIGGQSFEGQTSRSKKQAETTAAKVAFTGLKERKELVAITGLKEGKELVTSGRASLVPDVLSSGWQIKKALEASSSILQSAISGDLQQSAGPKANLVIHEEHNEEYIAGNKEKFAFNSTTASAQVNTHHAPTLPPEADSNVKRHRSSTSSDVMYATLRDPFPSTTSSPEAELSSPSFHSEGSSNSSTHSKNATPAAVGGTDALPRERILVYPRVPNMRFPNGATVLPFSDDKWVAMKMDSSQ